VLSEVHFRKYLTVFLLVLTISLTVPTFSILYAEVIIGRENQGVTIYIQAQDENGTPTANAHIKLYILTEEGKKLLSETTTDEYGRAALHITIPRKYIADDPNTKKPIYASINLEITASMQNAFGGQIFPLDPTHMNWPEDNKQITITLKTRTKQHTNIQPTNTCTPYNYYDTREYTEVLRYTTWDNISTNWYYPPGAKIRIQAKIRYYDIDCNPLNWEDYGYTEITLDAGLTQTYYDTGRSVHVLSFEVLYRLDYHEGDPYILGVWDEVYGVDTSTDPRDYSKYSTLWDGALPMYSNYYVTHQGDVRSIPVSGGDSWVFSVGVSFSVGVGVSVGVSLGVSKTSAPQSYLYIIVGVVGGSAYVLTTSPDASFLISYSNWIDPNRPR
jgi:hypothetical protein